MDGVEVSNNKAIEYRDHETPYLNAIVNKYEITNKFNLKSKLQLRQAGRPDHFEGGDLHEGVRERQLARF